ncbi:hypothetical protein [Methanoregula formicica]|uniref:Uncharacterized protein n=1 Tax=Methanoregula formicica (strain DSM 22288 / NBRC 105244 / SMSP) TaxID=593750 RepID=L0HE12_METFS|nr:hypothetical protein [Methanoregula formicica]AGB02026.1 hypothetical protein Metfor_0974 [Methanoregula formicica SMSP]
MNTGIIMIGLSLVLLSVGLISSPASAAFPDGGCGSAVMVPGSPHGATITSTWETSGTPVFPITSAGIRTYNHRMPGSS